MWKSCVSLTARTTERAITAFYDENLAPSGLTATRVPILATIRAGVHRPVDIARALSVDRSTMSRNLSRLEKEGLVRIEDGKGKTQRIDITSRGLEALALAYPLWLEVQAKLGSILDATEGPSVEKLVGRLQTLATSLKRS